MKNDCLKWKGPLLEAVLADPLAKTTSGELQEHLLACADCTQELAALRARREQLDTLLPLLVRGPEPAPDFRARVLAATHAQDAKKSRRFQPWPVWVVAVATPLVATALMIAIMLNQRTPQTAPGSELAMAEKLVQWRAPSDTLLATPGREILRTMPKLGDLYLKVPVKTDEEK